MSRSAFRFVAAAVALLLALAGCSTTMSPEQQEARELRDYCMRVTTQDMERCGVFFSSAGR